MMVLKSCSELECTQPWHALHLDGVVKDLKDALSRRYDGFYAEQPKVAYSLCERGYIKSPEGPQQWHVWQDDFKLEKGGAAMKETTQQQVFMYGDDWSLYT